MRAPHLYEAGTGAGQQGLAVRRDIGHAESTRHDERSRAGRQVPNLTTIRFSRAQQQVMSMPLRVGEPYVISNNNAPNRKTLERNLLKLGAAADVPNAYSAIGRTSPCYQTAAITHKSDVTNQRCMPGEAPHLLASGRIPEAR